MAKKHPKKHKDVHFEVTSADSTSDMVGFYEVGEAAAFAVARAAMDGRSQYLDVIVHSKAGAKWYAGDYGVEVYEEDPEASVHERFVIRASSEGRVA